MISSPTSRDAAQASDTARYGLAAVALAVALLVPLSVYCARFVAAERTLYRADQLAYWTYCSGLAETMRSSPLTAAVDVAGSVAYSELNLLPAVPIAAVMTVLGPSRFAYLVSVLNIYGLAVVAALVMALAMTRPKTRRPAPSTVVVAAAISIGLLPSLWQPIFIGYLGLGGVAVGLVTLALYLRREPGELPMKQLLLIGVLIAILAIFRRWYSFWSVALCVIILVESVVAAWQRRRLGLRSMAGALKPAIAIGATSAATLAGLAAPVALRRLSSGYSEEFVGFAGGGLVASLRSVVAEYGLITIAVALLAFAGLARSATTRRAAVVIGAQLVLTYLMMGRLQTHDPQHWYLYAAGLLLLIGSWIVTLLDGPATGRSRFVVGGAGLAAAGLVSSAVLLPSVGPVGDAIVPLVPSIRVRPAVRSDLDEVRRLMARLDAATSLRPGYVYVLGCTSALSEQSLAFINVSLGTDFRSPGLVLQTSHVDRRDGFPDMLLEADYVVVPDPPQFNLEASEQQVVIQPTRSFLDGTDIANAFRPMPGTYLLGDGVRVVVWQRVRPIRPEEIAELSDRLRSRYPDRPDIYSPR